LESLSLSASPSLTEQALRFFPWRHPNLKTLSLGPMDIPVMNVLLSRYVDQCRQLITLYLVWIKHSPFSSKERDDLVNVLSRSRIRKIYLRAPSPLILDAVKDASRNGTWIEVEK